jgi:hypothetical protein
MRRPSIVALKADHSATVGQHLSPGKHRQSLAATPLEAVAASHRRPQMNDTAMEDSWYLVCDRKKFKQVLEKDKSRELYELHLDNLFSQGKAWTFIEVKG